MFGFIATSHGGQPIHTAWDFKAPPPGGEYAAGPSEVKTIYKAAAFSVTQMFQQGGQEQRQPAAFKIKVVSILSSCTLVYSSFIWSKSTLSTTWLETLLLPDSCCHYHHTKWGWGGMRMVQMGNFSSWKEGRKRWGGGGTEVELDRQRAGELKIREGREIEVVCACSGVGCGGIKSKWVRGFGCREHIHQGSFLVSNWSDQR